MTYLFAMINLAFAQARLALPRVSKDERAQDTFEYLLIIGGIVVAVIAAIATPIGSSLITAVCSTVGSKVLSVTGGTGTIC